MIDTHAHLTDEKYADRIEQMVDEFRTEDLDMVFTVGTSMQNSKETIDFAEKHENIYAIIGVHPEDIDTYDKEELIKLANSSNKVIGIGEIGLDYHYRIDNKEEQKVVFISQLEVADELGLPVSIHSRDAAGATLDILRQNKHLLKHGGIWHCFNESLEVFKEIKKLGFVVGLGGVITFKNAKNSTIIVENMEMTDFVLETDCPYLTPEPFRGKAINEPKYVKYVAQHIADIKGISVDEVLDATNKNVYNLFKKVGKYE